MSRSILSSDHAAASALQRSGLTSARTALATALAGFDDPDEAREAADSVRRLTRSLVEAGQLRESPDVAAAAIAVLVASGPAIRPAAEAFAARLGEWVDGQAPRTGATVLIIEDDPDLAGALTAAVAGPDRTVLVAETTQAARDLFLRTPVSLVVLDLILPDGDGRNFLLELRSNPHTAGLPVFVVSARLGTRTRAECFALGADGYFEKPLDLQGFGVAVAARLERHGDLALLARRDLVTGLPNRAAFLEAVRRQRLEQPAGSPLALAILDLDYFSWIEETWGRQFGEDVLRRAGAHLANTLEDATSFARWDGAEFIGLFDGRDAAGAGAMVDRALTELRQTEFRPGDPTSLTLTFSAGVVEIPADQSLEDAIAHADQLCYIAKASGRNRVVAGDATSLVPTPRILLAEDDVNVGRLVANYLRGEGFDVVHFTDGAAALANAPDARPAAIVTDIEMPTLDGLGFLGGVRAHPELRHLPVMMLTAMGDEAYVVRAFELGADDYVLKPFTIREVTARLRRLLRRPSVFGIPAA